MGKSVLFKNAKNTVFKKWSKDFAEKGGKELGGKVMDGIIDQSIKKEAPKNLSKLTRISKEASDKVKPKSSLLNKNWSNRIEDIRDAATSNKDFNQRVKKVRKKELDRVTNKNAPTKKLFAETAESADTAQKEAAKKTSKIYGDKEARKNLKFSQDGPKKLYPIKNDTVTSSKENNFLRNTVPMAVGGAMIFTMANKRGQQSNSQLYGQQTPYQ